MCESNAWVEGVRKERYERLCRRFDAKNHHLCHFKMETWRKWFFFTAVQYIVFSSYWNRSNMKNKALQALGAFSETIPYRVILRCTALQIRTPWTITKVVQNMWFCAQLYYSSVACVRTNTPVYFKKILHLAKVENNRSTNSRTFSNINYLMV